MSHYLLYKYSPESSVTWLQRPVPRARDISSWVLILDFSRWLFLVCGEDGECHSIDCSLDSRWNWQHRVSSPVTMVGFRDGSRSHMVMKSPEASNRYAFWSSVSLFRHTSGRDLPLTPIFMDDGAQYVLANAQSLPPSIVESGDPGTDH